MLSESDRAELINNDFKLYSYGKALNAQEMYFAYMAASSARERLYVSYISGGEKGSESAIVRGIRNVLINIKTQSKNEEITLSQLESDENAFEILASNYNENTEIISSLKKYFANKAEYTQRLSAVERLIDNEELVLKDSELTKKLYKNDMLLSASRIESFYECAFKYFCRYGIKAKTIKKATLDPLQRGTVTHYVLERILSQKGSGGLCDLKDEEIALLVNGILDDYLKNRLGDYSEFSARFKYQFMRLSKMLVCVVKRLRDEFLQSDFEAKAFEVKIGNVDDGAQVQSKTIALDDGGSISIVGAVDRVDTFEKDGKKYIRVVDYKATNKDFLISDIINGLNLQMLVYLFTLANSESEYSGISSGILYMHSSRDVYTVERSAVDKGVEKKDNEDFKMRGIVLNDEENEIAKHMEKSLEGKYIPVTVSKDGILTGSIVTAAQLGAISGKVDSVIKQMGGYLHSGMIAQNPIDSKKHNNPCEYCDFAYVCQNRKEITRREIINLTNSEAMQSIEKEIENA